MTAHNTGRRFIATIAGIGVISAETLINVGHVRVPDLPWQSQTLVIAVAMTGVAQAIALMVMTDSWRRSRYFTALTAALALVAAVAFSTSTTYMRTKGALDANRTAAAAPYNAAKAKVDGLTTRKNDECGKRGPECRKTEGDLTLAQIELAKIKAPAASTHGALEIVPELALPLMLLLCGFAFIAYGEGTPDRTEAPRAQYDFPNPDTMTPAEIDDARKVFREPSNTLPRGPKGGTRSPAPTLLRGASDANSNVVEHPVLAALRNAGKPLTNDELAGAMGVTKGEASKRRREVQEKLVERRDGRYLRVAVA